MIGYIWFKQNSIHFIFTYVVVSNIPKQEIEHEGNINFNALFLWCIRSATGLDSGSSIVQSLDYAMRHWEKSVS